MPRAAPVATDVLLGTSSRVPEERGPSDYSIIRAWTVYGNITRSGDQSPDVSQLSHAPRSGSRSYNALLGMAGANASNGLVSVFGCVLIPQRGGNGVGLAIALGVDAADRVRGLRKLKGRD